MLIVTGNVSGPACAGTVFVEGLMHGSQDMRVAAHTEIVVGAPNSHSFILVRHVCAGEFLGEAIDVVEVAVRLVLVLLLQLGVVELFIVELGSRLVSSSNGRLGRLRIRD